MPTSNDEVTKKQQDLAKLREKVADEKVKRDTVLRESHNDVIMAQLDAEEARLNAELEAAKENTKAAREAVKATVKEYKAGEAGASTTAEPVPDGAAVSPTGGTPPAGDPLDDAANNQSEKE